MLSLWANRASFARPIQLSGKSCFVHPESRSAFALFVEWIRPCGTKLKIYITHSGPHPRKDEFIYVTSVEPLVFASLARMISRNIITKYRLSLGHTLRSKICLSLFILCPASMRQQSRFYLCVDECRLCCAVHSYYSGRFVILARVMRCVEFSLWPCSSVLCAASALPFLPIFENRHCIHLQAS